MEKRVRFSALGARSRSNWFI